MAYVDCIPNCCGIYELGHIADDDRPADSIMTYAQDGGGAHVVFSVTSSQTPKHYKGERLVSYIRRNKLGKVVSTAPAKNPNHDGTLKAWLWTPDKKILKTWQKRMEERFPTRYGPDSDYDPYYNPYGNGGNW